MIRKTNISSSVNALLLMKDGSMQGALPEAVPITSSFLNDLIELESNEWVYCCGSKIHRLQRGAVCVSEGFLLRIEDDHVEIAPSLQTMSINRASDLNSPIRSVSLINKDMKSISLFRYAPLIYWSAFGRDDIFQCLRVSMQSLFEVGQYSGDVMVLTDRPPDYIRSLVPMVDPNRILIGNMSPEDTVGYTFARYHIDEIIPQQYQPICYLDTDIMINAPIDELLVRTACSSCFWLTSEINAKSWLKKRTLLSLGDVGHYFGKWLFSDDEELANKNSFFYNSGAFAFANASVVQSLFQTMRSYEINFKRLLGEEMWKYYDQAFLNYLLAQQAAPPAASMDDFLAFNGKAEWQDGSAKGLLHFQGGVGKGAHKSQIMGQYLKFLRETAS